MLTKRERVELLLPVFPAQVVTTMSSPAAMAQINPVLAKLLKGKSASKGAKTTASSLLEPAPGAEAPVAGSPPPSLPPKGSASNLKRKSQGNGDGKAAAAPSQDAPTSDTDSESLGPHSGDAAPVLPVKKRGRPPKAKPEAKATPEGV